MAAAVRAAEPALLPEAPAMGAAVRAALLYKSPAKPGATLRGGLTTNVGLSIVANAAASVRIAASRVLTRRAATRVSGDCSWTQFPAARALSTANKIPPSGSGNLRDFLEGLAAGGASFLVAFAVGGAAAWFFRTESAEHADIVQDGELPESIDWSLLTCFPAVPDPCYNEYCGACWAIIAVKSIEAAFAVQNGFIFNLSIQQVIDCAAFEGCCGNTLDRAYDYITIAGLTTEKAYPGPPGRGRTVLHGLMGCYCKMEGKPVVARINSHVRIEPSEQSLMKALQTGPVAVYTNVNDQFDHYSGGILELEECPPFSKEPAIKHVLLVVGYGTDSEGNKFWKLMNTAGPDWGEKGYVRFRRCEQGPGVAGITEFSGFRPLLT